MIVSLDDGEILADLPRDAATAARVVRIEGRADLWSYAHPLLALTEISGSADLEGYAHELPALTRIGGSAYLRGYAHALPTLALIGGSAFLRDYAHMPHWIGYIGDDRRGYSFWADLARGRVRAGCHSFTPEEALAHWGPGGPSDRPDCLALAKQAIVLIERSKEVWT